MEFTPMNFIYNLIYIVKGELGTFAALGTIALSTIILNKIMEKKTNKEEVNMILYYICFI